jgi:hypothetical protein
MKNQLLFAHKLTDKQSLSDIKVKTCILEQKDMLKNQFHLLEHR